MPEKKRLLIINDGLAKRGESVYSSKPEYNVEIKIAKNTTGALAILDEWAKQGNSADIITFDLHEYNGAFEEKLVGGQHLIAIEEWAEKHSQLKPKKIFCHSNAQDDVEKMTEAANIDGHFGKELGPLLNFLRGGNEHASDNSALFKYIDSAWGIHVPSFEEQQKIDPYDREKIDPSHAVKAVKNNKYTPYQALKGLNIKKVQIRSCLEDKDYPHHQEDFEFFTDGAVNGHLAFTLADVKWLREQKKTVLFATHDLNSVAMELLPELGGIIVLGKGTGHSQYIFDAHGIPAAFDNSEGNLRLEEQDGKKYLIRPANPKQKENAYKLKAGDEVSLGIGRFYDAHLPIYEDIFDGVEVLAGWASEICRQEKGLAVKANADTAQQVEVAIQHGAQGIGLVRTEHMFFAPSKLSVLRNVLDASDPQTLSSAMPAFKAAQQNDFESLFKAVPKDKDFPVRIRLLDAPPEEFLEGGQLKNFIERVGVENTRGARLALKTPTLYAAQAEAIFDAAAKTGYSGTPEIMVPLIYNAEELGKIKQEVEGVAERKGFKGKYHFGAMIETLQAVDDAKNIARISDFISFGSNDLTAEIIGCARNDMKATQVWMQQHDYNGLSPFKTLIKPVLQIMQKATEALRSEKKDTDISVCGSQVSGDWESIKACNDIGLNSISVLPTAARLLESRIMAGKACALGLNEEKLHSQLTISAARQGNGYSSKISPRGNFSEDTPTGTTLPDQNDRESRNNQWDNDKSQ